ncbi:hypothetical protein [Paraburkholderia steynii]|uniref:hypothetical protein n=1 Tax=Paraburkholderia steynii TaxID=1245441 RepID=UPI00115FCA16|nr:hypothetical protein [Paraburkholderia steynii]
MNCALYLLRKQPKIPGPVSNFLAEDRNGHFRIALTHNTMKLARFSANGRIMVRVIEADKVYEINMPRRRCPMAIRQVQAADSSMQSKIEKSLVTAKGRMVLGEFNSRLRFQTPEILGYSGMNYQDHAGETRAADIPIRKTHL